MEGEIADEPLDAFYGDEVDERLGSPGEADGADEGAKASDGPTRAAEAGGGRRRTVTGALMAGIALGLREVFEPEYHDRTAIEQPAPEQPMEPQRYELHLDPIAPESSFAIYRPWVDGDPDPDADDADDDPDDADPGPGRPRSNPGGRGRTSGGAGALGG